MTTLSPAILSVFQSFSLVFSSSCSWSLALTLMPGLILLKGGRTVCRMLRFLGLKGERAFDKYHKLLNRNSWDLLKGSEILLKLLSKRSSKSDTLYIAADEHLERRRGSKIKAIGCFRDAVASTKGRKVTSFGLKWLVFSSLKQFSWSSNVFAMPFMTILTRSVESDCKSGRRHKTTTDWMCQAVKQIRRWVKGRVVLITDGGLASLELAWTCLSQDVHWITRLAANAALYDFPDTTKGRGRPRRVGEQLIKPSEMLLSDDLNWQKMEVRWYGNKCKEIEYVTFTCMRAVDRFRPVPVRVVLLRDPLKMFEPVTLMGVSSDFSLDALEIIEGYVSRWNLEVTFRESREHLGIETQRQWSDKAISRCTPTIFALYSLVLLIADKLHKTEPLVPLETAWYKKGHVTFSDALTAVRRDLWRTWKFNLGPSETGSSKNSNKPDPATLADYLAECA